MYVHMAYQDFIKDKDVARLESIVIMPTDSQFSIFLRSI